MDDPRAQQVATFLARLQQRLCEAVESLESAKRFERDGCEHSVR